jgi:tetratricopeptide (TPR) repeat protein
MLNSINNSNNIKNNTTKKIFNLRAEKLVREASDNFIYFKDYDTALNQVNEVLNLEKENVRALLLKGHILFCLDRDNEALEYFTLAAKIDPTSAEANGAKAGALDILGEQEEALASCKTAIDNITLKDRYLLPSLYDQKISILLRLKRYEEARTALNKCLKTLAEDDIHHLVSSYQHLINISCKEKNRKREQVKKNSMKLVN